MNSNNSNNASIKTKINVCVDDSRTVSVRLDLTNQLSKVREILEKTSEIMMDDTLLFSQKFSDEIGFVTISRENEEHFELEGIIEKGVDGTSYGTLYLVKTSKPLWMILNEFHKLDFGCTMTSNGIKRADKRAFVMEQCRLTKKSIKDVPVEISSEENWMMMKNNFFIFNNDVKYFAGLSKPNDVNYKDLPSYEYQKYVRATFKIGHLNATEDFIKRVNDAIESKDPKEFKQITEEFGQFIPIKTFLGGGKLTYDYDNDSSGNNYKLIGGDGSLESSDAWYDSLEDYRNWDCIEFREPISIFQLLDDDLRNKIHSIFGKRILYSGITREVKDSEPKIIDLPSEILRIKNKHADCSIFATVVGLEKPKYGYFHCQILFESASEEPKLIVHCFKKRSKDLEIQLVIGLMVVGYDTDFKFIFSDDNPRIEVLKENYNPSENMGSKMFKLTPNKRNSYYLGIPVIYKSDSTVIGHYFTVRESAKTTELTSATETELIAAESKSTSAELYTFAYSLKTNECVKLPKFSFHILDISNYNTPNIAPFIIPFEKKMKSSSITNFDRRDEFRKIKYAPKFISLYTNKSESILLKQRFTQIKVKFLDKKKSSGDGDLKCLFFAPYQRIHRTNSIDNYFRKPATGIISGIGSGISGISSGISSGLSSGLSSSISGISGIFSKLGVNQKQMNEGANQKQIEKGANQKKIEEGAYQKQIEDANQKKIEIHKQIDEGANQNQIDEGANQNKIDEQNQIDEGVNQNKIDEGASQNKIDEGADQNKIENISHETLLPILPFEKYEKYDDEPKSERLKKYIHKKTRQDFAFKIVDKDRINKKVTILNKIKDCRNIIQYYGLAFDGYTHYLVTEWAENGNLREYISNHGPNIDIKLRIVLACDIAKGLNFLNTVKIVHQDIRAENIVITDHDVAKITNVESSREFGDATDNLVISEERVRYCAPEILADKEKKYDTKCEIYSFGILLWEIAECRAAPYEEFDDFMEVTKKAIDGYREPFTTGTAIPEKYQNLVNEAVNKDPDLRPTLEEMLTDLKDIFNNYNSEQHNVLERRIMSTMSTMSPKTIVKKASQVFDWMTIDEAVEKHNKENTDKSLLYKCFDSYANMGDPKGKYWKAYYITKGWSDLTCSENEKQEIAAKLFKEAADHGDEFPDSQLRYAMMVKRGKGVKQNNDIAIEYFLKAAKNDHVVSMYNVANYYFYNGNKELGKEYMIKAADKGYEEAINYCKENSIS